jgi:ABC-type molybdate transport system substrate-binding protein
MRGLVAVLLAGVLAAGGCAGASPGANDAGPGDVTGPAAPSGAVPRQGDGTGNGTAGGNEAQAGLVELKVAVDESLADTFVEVERGFEAQNPNVEVVLSYGEGSILADRIAGGEPADVFATDDPFAAQGVSLNAEPVAVGRVSLVLVKPGKGAEFVAFVREGGGRRILIDSGLARP